jgi:hypothetical protein
MIFLKWVMSANARRVAWVDLCLYLCGLRGLMPASWLALASIATGVGPVQLGSA